MDNGEFIPEIGIVDYEGAQAASVLGMTDLFAAAEARARAQGGGNPLRLRISHWRTATGQSPPERTYDTLPGASGHPTVIIVPPGLGDPPAKAVAEVYAAWLRDQHSKGSVLGSVCKGAFLLGETGLFAGRTVTTHWTYEEQLIRTFPDVSINTDRIIIDDGDILTAGGVMAWIDLSLKLIERFLGPNVMLDTARAFLVDPPGREQSYYSAFSPRLNHGDAAILKVQHWLQATEGKESGLSALAEQAGLEQRTFMRRFQKATGHTTGEYVQRLRMHKARDLLQFTHDPVDTVAWKVHYSDPSAFRKVFNRVVGLTPAEYRQRFRGGL